MRPLPGTHNEDPAHGIYNDSYRTCIASLIHKDPKGIPHFSNFNKPIAESHREAKIWLARWKLSMVEIIYELKTIEGMLATWLAQNPSAYCILGGRTETLITKFVIVLRGKIEYDPHPQLGPMVHPCADGNFSVQLLVPIEMMKFAGG